MAMNIRKLALLDRYATIGKICCSVIFIACIAVAYAAESLADMYKYVDANGSVCITNDRDAVPKKYRGRMTVIKEESESPKKMLPELQKIDRDPQPTAVVTESQPVQEPAPAPADNRQKYIRTAMIIGAMMAGWFILNRLTGAIGSPKVTTLLFLMVILAGGVFLYRLYMEEMRNVFGSLRRDALNIKSNVETRENKTERMMQQITEQENEQKKTEE